jgi:DNA-binding NarL/FixJ family response regulator
MPQMSGPELAKRLAKARPEMKVLCMSGYTDDSIVRHGVLATRLAFLQKPITPEALTTKVREVLDSPEERGA